MRPLVRVLRRSQFVATASQNITSKDACKTMMGSIGCFQVGNRSIGMGMPWKCTRPLPMHVPLRFCSSQIPGKMPVETAGCANCPDASELVKEIAIYAGQVVQNNPDAVAAALYSSLLFFACHIFPRILMKLRVESPKYYEYEYCIRMSLVNTENKLSKYYPTAAISWVVFSKMTSIIAPSMQDHIPQLWQGASILSILWFLNSLKENFVDEAKRKGGLIDLKWVSRFDKIASGGLIALGLLGAGEVSGLSLQSLMTISGAGGVLTAFAGKDILGNMLSGFNLQLTEPFVVGEFIKAGSVEGTVVNIGLTCTSLINAEKLPITVPNSYFLAQVILNRSRATIRSCVKTIPIKFADVERIFTLTREVNLMLKKNPLVTLEREAPSCFVSRVGKHYGELVISCETHVEHEGLMALEQDIVLETLRIMRSIGVEVGDPLPSGDLEALLEAAKIIKSREASSYSG